jgi:truncated hemoglobin YjbI
MASRIAKVILLANRLGKPLTPKQAYDTARQELRAYKTAFYDSLDEDKLVEELGKENAEKVRKHFLNKLKEKDAKVKNSTTGTSSTPKREERKTMNSDEFRAYLDDLKSKGK